MIKLRSLLAATLGIAMLGVFAAGAAAAPISFGGNPLTVYVDELGQCQTSYLVRDETSGNFYPGGGEAFFSPTGDCGFFIATPSSPSSGLKPQPTDLRGEEETGGIVFGFDGHAGPFINTKYVPVSNGPVTGSGTAADPYKLVTIYDVTDSTENASETGKNAVLQITQTATYVTGNPYFTAYYDVKNVTDLLPTSGVHKDLDANKTIYYRAIYAGDLFVNGNDHGTGVFLSGPPRFVGGQNQTSGVLGGFQEELKGLDGSPVPAWSSFAEDYWASEEGGGIWHDVEHSANAPAAFPDSVSPTDWDNGAGVAWDTNYSEGHGLEPGQDQKYAIVNFTTVPSSLQVSPVSQGLPQGATATITVKAVNSANQPYANTTLRFTIAGANPQSGLATTDAQGVAQIHYVGTNPGTDLVSMYLDLGNTGSQVAADPTGTAQVTFVPTPPPPPNSTVTIKSVKINSDGSVSITYIPSDPGLGTLTVEVPTASVARRHAAKKCKRGTVKIRGRCLPRTSLVGLTKGQGTPGVPLTLTVTPSSQTRKALAKGRKLHVLATLSYQSAKGGAPSLHLYHLTLKGHKPKHKHHRR